MPCRTLTAVSAIQTHEASPSEPVSYYRARYYDPQAARFLNEDPVHFKSGDDFYLYVSNRAIDYVDPSGESPADVVKLQNFFKNVIDQMTKDGSRTDPGWWNNIVHTFTGRHLGCADQTQVVNNQFDSNLPGFHLDNNWGFQTHTSLGGAHTYGVAVSPNPNDPDIYVDPLKGIVLPVPKGTK